MSALTNDPDNPRLTHGPDTERVAQADAYLVLSERERARGFVRPVRYKYRHLACDTVTSMSVPIAETFAANPSFYGATFCVTCSKHLPVGEFRWADDGLVMGS